MVFIWWVRPPIKGPVLLKRTATRSSNAYFIVLYYVFHLTGVLTGWIYRLRCRFVCLSVCPPPSGGLYLYIYQTLRIWLRIQFRQFLWIFLDWQDPETLRPWDPETLRPWDPKDHETQGLQKLNQSVFKFYTTQHKMAQKERLRVQASSAAKLPHSIIQEEIKYLHNSSPPHGHEVLSPVWSGIIPGTVLHKNTSMELPIFQIGLMWGDFLELIHNLCYTEPPYRSCSLPAKFADSVVLKDGLLNNRVCTVKFLVVESYFSCNTTHTCKDAPGH